VKDRSNSGPDPNPHHAVGHSRVGAPCHSQHPLSIMGARIVSHDLADVAAIAMRGLAVLAVGSTIELTPTSALLRGLKLFRMKQGTNFHLRVHAHGTATSPRTWQTCSMLMLKRRAEDP
jgi:hypothetical protein